MSNSLIASSLVISFHTPLLSCFEIKFLSRITVCTTVPSFLKMSNISLNSLIEKSEKIAYKIIGGEAIITFEEKESFFW